MTIPATASTLVQHRAPCKIEVLFNKLLSCSGLIKAVCQILPRFTDLQTVEQHANKKKSPNFFKTESVWECYSLRGTEICKQVENRSRNYIYSLGAV